MIVNLSEIPKLVKNLGDKKIGLITGCFDILHLGHIQLFEFGKNHVDTLLVGIESDTSVKINKGENRPMFEESARLKVVDAIRFVDYVFIVDHNLNFNDEKLNDYFMQLYSRLKITHLITNKLADGSYKNKEKRARQLNIKVILQDDPKFNSSSNIIKTLGI